MTPADLARANAISFECKKDALQQRQSGDWKISFTVQGVDMDGRLTRAAMGTRFVAVLVEVNDQELPTTQAEKESNKPAPIRTSAKPLPDKAPTYDKPPAGASRNWRDVPPAQQAGIRINEPTFAAYLREEHPDEWHETGEADACLKFICKIESKRDLAHNHKANALWHQLDTEYSAWVLRERVGA